MKTQLERVYYYTNIGRYDQGILIVNDVIVGDFKTRIINDAEVIFGFKIGAEYQRLGYGNFLLSEYLKMKKHIDVYLHVYSDNVKAINLYRKNGFNENYENLICDDAYTPKLPITGYIIQMKKNKK